jgi:hypothetical protein
MYHSPVTNMPIDAGAPRVESTYPGVDLCLLAGQGGLFACEAGVYHCKEVLPHQHTEHL